MYAGFLMGKNKRLNISKKKEILTASIASLRGTKMSLPLQFDVFQSRLSSKSSEKKRRLSFSSPLINRLF